MAIGVEAADYDTRYYYLNNVSVPKSGYTTGSLYKRQQGFQYIINKNSNTFDAQLTGNDSNGTYGTSVKYAIQGKQSGEINKNNSSQLNFGFGIGDTKLTLYSKKLFESSSFQGAWIPDQEFYDFVIANGGI